MRIVLEFQVQALFVDVGLVRCHNRRQHFGKVDLLTLDGLGAAFQTRKLQQRIDQTGKATHFGIQRFQTLGIRFEHAIDHRLNGRLDGHKRRAQLMGNVGYQPALQLAVLLHGIGHGVEHITQTGNLVGALHAGTCRIIALFQRLSRVRDAANGGDKRAGEQHSHHNRDSHRDERSKDHGLV